MKRIYEHIKSIACTLKDSDIMRVVLFGCIMAIVILICSCKTTKSTINDKSEIKDSTRVETTFRQDSTLTQQNTETTQETSEKEVTTEDTTITFGSGGGTYNTNTGEATNVSSIKTSKESERLKTELSTLQEKYKQSQSTLQSIRDSIAKIDRDMDIESKVEETYQASWYWWLAIGALLMLVAIVVIRKIPAISWLLFWI